MENALETPVFLKNIEIVKNNTYSELKEKLYKAKLSAIRDFLQRKDIEVDYRITDINTLKDQIKDKREIYIELENFEKSFDNDLNNIIESLKNGSQNVFQRYGKVLKSIANTTITGMAIRTAGTLLMPSIPKAALTGAAIATPRIYKGIKGYIEQKKDISENAINVTLLNLAKVEEDEEIQMNIASNVRQIVTEQFKERGIKINNSDTISFLSSITSLKTENKIQAINLINSLTGDRYNINEEIKKNNKDISHIAKSMKKTVISPIASGVMVGLHTASVINDTVGDEVAATLTGLGSTVLSGNMALGLTTGGSQYALSKFGNLIPVAGPFVEQMTSTINNAENYLFTSGAGLAIAGVGVASGLAYKGIKGIIQKKKDSKNNDVVNKALKESIYERIQEAKDNTQEELQSRTNKQVILDIVCDELRKNGMDIPNNLRDTFELRTIIKQESIGKKIKVLNLVKNLEKIEKENTKNFKDIVKQYTKYAYYGGIITLAGLGAYDMFINPSFLENIRYTPKQLKELTEESKKDLLSTVKDVNQNVEKFKNIDPNLLSNGNQIKMIALGKDKVPKSLVETLENSGTNIDFSSFEPSPEVKEWMTTYGLEDFKDVKEYISGLKISDASYIDAVKTSNAGLYDILKDNLKTKKIFGFIPTEKYIDWDSIKLNSKMIDELKRMGVEPDVNGLKEWIKSLGTDSMRVKDNFEDVPISLYQLACKEKNVNFSKEDLDSIFHTTTMEELHQLGYTDIYEFQKALESVNVHDLAQNLNIDGKFIPDNSTINDMQDIIENAQLNQDFVTMMNISDITYNTNLSEQFKNALYTINQINQYQNIEKFIETVKYSEAFRSPAKVFGIGAVIGTTFNGIKNIFKRNKEKEQLGLPEVKNSDNYKRERNMDEELKVKLTDYQVDRNNKNEEENTKNKIEIDDIGEL